MLVSCVDAPAVTASAVLLSDDDTGNPPTNPAAAFAPAEREELLVGVDTVAGSTGERPTSQHVAAERNHRHTGRRREHARPQVRRNARKRERWQTTRDGADGGHSSTLQIECRRDRGRAENDQEWTGYTRETLQREQRADDGKADQEWRELDVLDAACDVDRAINSVPTLCRDSTEVRELRHHHDDRDACEVTDEYRSRQEVGEKPEPNDPRHERQHTHCDGERGGRRGGIHVGRAGQGCDRGPHEQGGSTLGPDRQHPTRPQERVQHQGGQRRP